MIHKALMIALLAVIFMSPALTEIYINYGQVRAFCPNGYCSPIPQGLAGISFGVKYGKDAEWEKLLAHCRELYPLPCDALD